MNTTALLFMIISEAAITALTVYFFVKVLRSKKKGEPDSYSEE
ncbi:MAG TPA: hypothetical protein PLP88_03955 [Bacteroidales bacterium]|nr:hypothetical protein [Bacteroidales bacterium]